MFYGSKFCNSDYCCNTDIQVGLAVGTTEKDAENATLTNIKLRVSTAALVYMHVKHIPFL